MGNATDNLSRSTSRLFAAVRTAQDPELRLADPHEQARARARLLQSVERVSKPAQHQGSTQSIQGWRWGIAAGFGAAACTAALLFGLPSPDGPAVVGVTTSAPADRPNLEFRLEPSNQRGFEVAANTQVVAGDQPQRLAVSDDTLIELAPRGSLHLESIQANGATVVLEHGEVSLAVHHEEDTSWRVAAGPWSVHVTGTQFVVAWEPSTSQLRVAVTEGSVRVEGPNGEVSQLGAGDELSRSHSVASIVASIDPDLLLEPDDAASQIAGPPIPAAKTSKPDKVHGRGWNRYFTDADYEGAWDALAAAPGGIHGEAERVADARTLLDLADVARFTKHSTDTRKLLERLRLRFPTSNEASEAAFALGRLAGDHGSHAKAAEWFERYLDERSSGSFAGDALGRLIDCYDALGQTDDAKSAAQRYLAGHPGGPHAAKAKKILAR